MGLRPTLPLRSRARRRVPGLPPHLQSPPRPHRTQGRLTSRPRTQPLWTEHLDLHCQTLLDPDTDHTLLVFTATPGTPNHDTLQLLAVLGRTPPKGGSLISAQGRRFEGCYGVAGP